MSRSRKILITGASGGLGLAVIEKFAQNGDAVVAVHSPRETPLAVSGVEWVSADLTKKTEVDKIFEKFDGLDAVVHCAGGFRFGMIDSISESDFRFLNSLNFESAFFVARAAVPEIRKRGGGSMLFISSLATQAPSAGMSAYAATKAAVNGMVLSLATELKKEGIRVNAVLPSIIDTPANRSAMPGSDPSTWVSTRDLAQILYRLTLDESKSITGALIPVPGRT